MLKLAQKILNFKQGRCGAEGGERQVRSRCIPNVYVAFPWLQNWKRRLVGGWDRIMALEMALHAFKWTLVCESSSSPVAPLIMHLLQIPRPVSRLLLRIGVLLASPLTGDRT